MRILHFCAGLQGWNGMANTARQFVAEEIAAGNASRLTNRLDEITAPLDVVHVHGAWLPEVHRAAKRAKAIGAKLIIRPAGSYDPVRRHFHAWKKRLMAPWEHRMLKRADVVLATCSQEADWIRAYHPGAPVEVTDLRRFFKVSGAIRPRPRTANETVHVLYLGRHHPLKGVAYLERAVAAINEEEARSDLPAIELKEVSDTYGDELEKIWTWCDVLCLPTLSENFGRVVAEALEHGRFVITTDGAPAWSDLQPTHGVYLRGYRDGDDQTRVRLLKDALLRFVDRERT